MLRTVGKGSAARAVSYKALQQMGIDPTQPLSPQDEKRVLSGQSEQGVDLSQPVRDISASRIELGTFTIDGDTAKVDLIRNPNRNRPNEAIVRVTYPGDKPQNVALLNSERPLKAVIADLRKDALNDGDFKVNVRIIPTRAKQTAQKEQQKRATDSYVYDAKQRIKAIEQKKYPSNNERIELASLKAQIKVNPNKFQVGQNVAYSFGEGSRRQTNRGFQITEVDKANRRVKVRQVRDTGITSTGGQSRLADSWVDMHTVTQDAGRQKTAIYPSY